MEDQNQITTYESDPSVIDQTYLQQTVGVSYSEEYTTQNGVITVEYKITLGEMVVSISIILMLVAFIAKWFIDAIWRSR